MSKRRRILCESAQCKKNTGSPLSGLVGGGEWGGGGVPSIEKSSEGFRVWGFWVECISTLNPSCPDCRAYALKLEPAYREPRPPPIGAWDGWGALLKQRWVCPVGGIWGFLGLTGVGLKVYDLVLAKQMSRRPTSQTCKLLCLGLGFRV